MDTVQQLPTTGSKAGLTIANVASDPPAQALMLALTGYGKPGGPLYLDAKIVGEQAGLQTLAGAHWFGWHIDLNMAVDLGPIDNGYDFTVSTTKAKREVLAFVAGVFSHVGIGMCTLSASTVALHVAPLVVEA